MRFIRMKSKTGVKETSRRKEVQLHRGALKVDCASCHGGQSLGNRSCLKCVLTNMGGRPVRSIELDGDWEVGYGENVASALIDVSRAYVLALETRDLARNSEACRSCRSSPHNLLSPLLEGFPAILHTAPARAPSQNKLGVGCSECFSRMERAGSALVAAVQDLDNRLARELYLVAKPTRIEDHAHRSPPTSRSDPK